MKPLRLYYPWLSTLGALALVGWQAGLTYPGLMVIDGWPPLLRDPASLGYGAAILVLLAGFDLWRFACAKARCRERLQQYERQIGELFDSKRELGTRARTFSDHADKLKMFISERLLETIEYDEKFLHFKNIASEVRHNGVISYDKAQTALAQAQQDCDPVARRQYQEAADSLLYLWDLLDLSTTDNLALYVANRIYDCEEHYFQSMLNPEALDGPFRPTFMMSQALRRALLPICEDADVLGLNDDWPKRGVYRDDKFHIRLSNDSELLGKENHMVLMIENLLNNALFYSRQKGYKGRYSQVAIQLGQQDGQVMLRVYNRGPHIDEDERDKIYQLGFSSRRVREHHGKGLGLYFVNEIVKGFEGSIEFENIANRARDFHFSIKLTSGEILQRDVACTDVGGKLMCREGDEAAPLSKRVDWSLPAPIASVEVGVGAGRKPQLISDLSASEDRTHLDQDNERMPRWVIELRNRKRSATLRFAPLDLRGVEFRVRLPNAGSRLDQED
ncbi:MAG: ATP-binding protein [Gammaproteobacteria bacterium]|nr:ATP-binding protein [Gammaproteobacteria bacterium]